MTAPRIVVPLALLALLGVVVWRGMRQKGSLMRKIIWCYRAIYRPSGYGRFRSVKCAVLVNVMPAVVRWQERRDGDYQRWANGGRR